MNDDELIKILIKKFHYLGFREVTKNALIKLIEKISFEKYNRPKYRYIWFRFTQAIDCEYRRSNSIYDLFIRKIRRRKYDNKNSHNKRIYLHICNELDKYSYNLKAKRSNFVITIV